MQERGAASQALIQRIHDRALAIAMLSIVVNVVILLVSLVVWSLAIVYGWLDSVVFVSHVSMLALVFSAISGVAGALAGLLAVVPTDDVIEPGQ